MARIRGSSRTADQLNPAAIFFPIKIGGLCILSYKTIRTQAHAAAAEAADTTLAPIFTPGTLPASTQLLTQHPRCQVILTGSKEALLSSLTPEWAKALIEASSKLGRVWLTTMPSPPSLRLTDVVLRLRGHFNTSTLSALFSTSRNIQYCTVVWVARAPQCSL